MVGVYKIKEDKQGLYIKYYNHKYYIKGFNKLNIKSIIDYNNGWVIFK